MVLDKENDGGGKYKLRSNEANFTVILVVKFASFDRVYTSSSTVDPKTPRAKQDFGEFRMQFVGPGF